MNFLASRVLSCCAEPTPLATHASTSNLLTYALTVNSLALWRHQTRHGDPPLPLAS